MSDTIIDEIRRQAEKVQRILDDYNDPSNDVVYFADAHIAMQTYLLLQIYERMDKSMRRYHITVRREPDIISEEITIDLAIEDGLAELCKRHRARMNIVNAVPVFRNDGVLFVTVIAEETAQIPATIKPFQ
jgi:hypothetical protein